MEYRFGEGDLLFFQLESGFALIKLLAVEDLGGDAIWHVSAFNELFPDVDSIENAIERSSTFSSMIPHVVLTNRAFESTQVAKIGGSSLSEQERRHVETWRSDPNRIVSDLSIRLLTGLR
jgi:hypothetical protein